MHEYVLKNPGDNCATFSGMVTVEFRIEVSVRNPSVSVSAWFQDGKLHRDEDEPAVVVESSHDGVCVREWWVRGRLHRDGDAPAVSRSGTPFRLARQTYMSRGVAQMLLEGVKGAGEGAADGRRGGIDNALRDFLRDLQIRHIESEDQLNLWFRHGKLHRDGDAPAVVDLDLGNLLWFRDGVLHREDGPALIGSESRFCGGEDFASRCNSASCACGLCGSKYGWRLWVQDGVLHRRPDPVSRTWTGCTTGMGEPTSTGEPTTGLGGGWDMSDLPPVTYIRHEELCEYGFWISDGRQTRASVAWLVPRTCRPVTPALHSSVLSFLGGSSTGVGEGAGDSVVTVHVDEWMPLDDSDPHAPTYVVKQVTRKYAGPIPDGVVPFTCRHLKTRRDDHDSFADAGGRSIKNVYIELHGLSAVASPALTSVTSEVFAEVWTRDGQPHRAGNCDGDGDLPAVVFADGTREWWTHGRLNRAPSAGPAVIMPAWKQWEESCQYRLGVCADMGVGTGSCSGRHSSDDRLRDPRQWQQDRSLKRQEGISVPAPATIPLGWCWTRVLVGEAGIAFARGPVGGISYTHGCGDDDEALVASVDAQGPNTKMLEEFWVAGTRQSPPTKTNSCCQGNQHFRIRLASHGDHEYDMETSVVPRVKRVRVA